MDGTMCWIILNRHFLCMSPLESIFWRLHGVEDRVELILFGMIIEVDHKRKSWMIGRWVFFPIEWLWSFSFWSVCHLLHYLLTPYSLVGGKDESLFTQTWATDLRVYGRSSDITINAFFFVHFRLRSICCQTDGQAKDCWRRWCRVRVLPLASLHPNRIFKVEISLE